jgi:HrpA-like RNA helicase
MSATLDTKLLTNYYSGSSLLEVAGRAYPIEDEYADDDIENYVEASIAKTLEIHNSKVPGDILIFLTGPDEIDRAVEDVQEKLKDTAVVLPLHGKLIEKETQRVFEPVDGNKRKIIFSTNVAETSITIDGIRHVIESGMVKEALWDEKRHMQVLKIGTITQSSVKQRRGRAGRTSPGKVIHFINTEKHNERHISFSVTIYIPKKCTNHSTSVLGLRFYVFNQVLPY